MDPLSDGDPLSVDEGASYEVGLDETPQVDHEEREAEKKVTVLSCVEGGQRTQGDLGGRLLLPQEHQHQIRSSWQRPQLPEMDDV